MPVIIELEEKLLRERVGDADRGLHGARPGGADQARPARLPADGEPGHRRPLRGHPSQPERAAAGLSSTGEALSRNAHRADPDPAIDEQPRQPRHQEHRDESERAAHQTRHCRRPAAHGGHQCRAHQPARLPSTGSFPPPKSPTAWSPCGRPWTNTGCWARSSTAAWIRWPTASPTRSPRPIAPWPNSAAPAENLRTMLGPDSPLRNDLDQLLQQLAGAAQSISTLVEFLKQHPNALITGREILPRSHETRTQVQTSATVARQSEAEPWNPAPL